MADDGIVGRRLEVAVGGTQPKVDREAGRGEHGHKDDHGPEARGVGAIFGFLDRFRNGFDRQGCSPGHRGSSVWLPEFSEFPVARKLPQRWGRDNPHLGLS